MYTIYLHILTAMVFAAFFSGVETAFASASKMRFQLDTHRQSLISKLLALYYRHPDDFVTALLTGYNLSLVVYGILVAQAVESWLPATVTAYPGILLLIEIVIAACVMLITGEFLPKTVFRINPNRTMTVFALPMFLLYVVLYPLAKVLSLLGRGLLRLTGNRIDRTATRNALGKTDLDYFIQSSLPANEDEENLDPEVRIFQNALDFSNIKIRDCIVPRTEIQAVDTSTSLDDLKLHFIESGHSKLIVYQGNIDNIVGYIHSSELFRHPEDWTSHVRQVPIVPETMAAQKLMEIFMQQKKSLAVVVDEFGGTSGIVSLEDLVEEIFGDIEDEHDTTSYIAKQLNEQEYILSARLEIEKVNEMFELSLPEDEDYLTIGGLILHVYQSFPKLNETVNVGKYQFKIIKRTTTKIELVRLKVVE